MTHIDASEIELISKALLNVPASSYTYALDGMRKLYTGRGITDAEFDELLGQLQEKAVSTPIHDYAFVLHVLGLLYGKKRKHPLRYDKMLKRLKSEFLSPDFNSKRDLLSENLTDCQLETG